MAKKIKIRPLDDRVVVEPIADDSTDTADGEETVQIEAMDVSFALDEGDMYQNTGIELDGFS